MKVISIKFIINFVWVIFLCVHVQASMLCNFEPDSTQSRWKTVWTSMPYNYWRHSVVYAGGSPDYVALRIGHSTTAGSQDWLLTLSGITANQFVYRIRAGNLSSASNLSYRLVFVCSGNSSAPGEHWPNMATLPSIPSNLSWAVGTVDVSGWPHINAFAFLLDKGAGSVTSDVGIDVDYVQFDGVEVDPRDDGTCRWGMTQVYNYGLAHITGYAPSGWTSGQVGLLQLDMDPTRDEEASCRYYWYGNNGEGVLSGSIYSNFAWDWRAQPGTDPRTLDIDLWVQRPDYSWVQVRDWGYYGNVTEMQPSSQWSHVVIDVSSQVAEEEMIGLAFELSDNNAYSSGFSGLKGIEIDNLALISNTQDSTYPLGSVNGMYYPNNFNLTLSQYMRDQWFSQMSAWMDTAYWSSRANDTGWKYFWTQAFREIPPHIYYYKMTGNTEYRDRVLAYLDGFLIDRMVESDGRVHTVYDWYNQRYDYWGDDPGIYEPYPRPYTMSDSIMGLCVGYNLTGDTTYLNKAKLIADWMITNWWDTWDWAYYDEILACSVLYKITGESQYLNFAQHVADHLLMYDGQDVHGVFVNGNLFWGITPLWSLGALYSITKDTSLYNVIQFACDSGGWTVYAERLLTNQAGSSAEYGRLIWALLSGIVSTNDPVKKENWANLVRLVFQDVYDQQWFNTQYGSYRWEAWGEGNGECTVDVANAQIWYWFLLDDYGLKGFNPRSNPYTAVQSWELYE